MKLYFSPLACSMATRIALYEAGLDADYQHVGHESRRAPDGTDVRDIHPLGYVPVVRTDHGSILTENAAILQYVASLAAPGTLAPTTADERAQLQQWLSFIGTELHKAVFLPLLDKTAPEGARQYALANAEHRLPALAAHLDGRTFVLDRFSVADAYLFTVLNWAQVTPIRLARWPAIAAYMARMRERDAFARALAEETDQFVRERGRPTAPPAHANV
jgi:glutathione S-transferase